VDPLNIEGGILHRITEDNECDIIISLKKQSSIIIKVISIGNETYESKPRKDEIEYLIHQLHMDPEFAHHSMRRPINIVEMNGTVHCSEERTIQPTPPL
jgi:hypothetical protein